MKAVGFSVLGVGTSSDGEGASASAVLKAVSFYYKMLNEPPDAYMICRTAADIDKAIAEDKLGWYFIHQGTVHFEGDPDKVALFHRLGYGYCLLAYNNRNPYGDGIFEPDGYTAKMGATGVAMPDPSSCLPALIDTMLEHGYTEEDCENFVGGNSYRV